MITNKDELEFGIFCIESVANALNITGNKVFDMLNKQSDIFSKYIIPNYNTLHTQSKEYIIEDIVSLMRERGLSI